MKLECIRGVVSGMRETAYVDGSIGEDSRGRVTGSVTTQHSMYFMLSGRPIVLRGDFYISEGDDLAVVGRPQGGLLDVVAFANPTKDLGMCPGGRGLLIVASIFLLIGVGCISVFTWIFTSDPWFAASNRAGATGWTAVAFGVATLCFNQYRRVRDVSRLLTRVLSAERDAAFAAHTGGAREFRAWGAAAVIVGGAYGGFALIVPPAAHVACSMAQTYPEMIAAAQTHQNRGHSRSVYSILATYEPIHVWKNLGDVGPRVRYELLPATIRVPGDIQLPLAWESLKKSPRGSPQRVILRNGTQGTLQYDDAVRLARRRDELAMAGVAEDRAPRVPDRR